jgi:hypothetical protein
VIAVSDINESRLALARIIDAMFCSDLKTGTAPTGRQLAHAIRDALRKHRNWNGMTRAVGEAFGSAPVEAQRREEWCREIAEQALSSKDTTLSLDDLLR